MAKIDLKENEFFERFIGSEPISSYDTQFWYHLLSCSFNFSRISSQTAQEKHVYDTLKPFIDLLALNNSQSLNIGALVKVAIDRISRIHSQSGQQSSVNPFYGFQSFNSIFLLRIICKNIIENSSEDMLIQSFRAREDVPPPAPKVPNSSTAILPHLQKVQEQPTRDVATPIQPQQQPEAEQDQSLEQQPAALSPEFANENSNQSETQAPPEVIQTVQQPTNQAEPKQSTQAKSPEIITGSNMLDQYISVLISLIVDMPSNDSTYLLQVEAINNLIVLLSVQMYSNNQASQSHVYRTLMLKKCSIHALVLTKTLLNNFIRQTPIPQEGGSLIFGAAWMIEKTLWRVLTLGFGGSLEESSIDEGLPLLARQSLLLLNVLTNHHTSDKNPYREAVVSCQHQCKTKFNLADPNTAFNETNNQLLTTVADSKSIMVSNSIKVEFNELYDTICKNLQNNQVALLLYLLLHSNKLFKPFILTTCSQKLDQLVLPLLKILYTSIQKGSHAIYLIVILFVILSEEESFSRSIHMIHLNGVPWFTDRILNDISLGSFTTLIMIRSFQYNTFRVRDTFLHTNLFATLGNLSNHFTNLHPYVCVRIVDLLERLTKRYMAIVKPPPPVIAIEKITIKHNTTLDVLSKDNPLARALATDTQKQDLQDVSSIELDSSTNYSNNHSSNQNGNSAINISAAVENSVGASNNTSNASILVDKTSQHATISSSGQQSPGSSNSEHVNILMDDSNCDTAWLEEVIKMILEIINNSLAVQLNSNSSLVYTLLYKRNVFNSLMSSHLSFYDQVVNIERVLTFFFNKIEAQQEQLSVDEIKSIIVDSIKEWNFHQTRDPNSQLLFRYVEDDKPEDFFIPYMWEQIYYSSGISWNAKRIVLFNPEMA